MAYSINDFDFQVYILPSLQLHLKLGDKQTTMDTKSSLRTRQWTLIGVNIVDSKMIQVFFNSKLEIQLLLDESEFELKNNGIFYIGGDQWHRASYRGFVDEIRFSRKTLSVEQQLKVLSQIYPVHGLFKRVSLGCL